MAQSTYKGHVELVSWYDAGDYNAQMSINWWVWGEWVGAKEKKNNNTMH